MSHALRVAVAILASCAVADADPDPRPPRFLIERVPPGAGAAPAGATPASLAGSRIAALPDGNALVIDADSGALIKTGDHPVRIDIGRDAGMLVFDDATNMAFVVDRRHDRVVAVRVGDTLEVVTRWATPREPYGIALMPDRRSMVITSIADRTAVAYSRDGGEQWRVPVAVEPRGIAIAPDGSRALVAHATTNVVTEIALATRDVRRIAVCCGAIRGGFAIAFMGDHQAVMGVQRSVPVSMTGQHVSLGHYGGSQFVPPISQQLAFIGLTGEPSVLTATIAQNQVRSLAWDRAHDALYVAGLGDDSVFQINNASQIDLDKGFTAQLGGRCGPDGLAIAPDGQLLVWCSFTRTVTRVRGGRVVPGSELVASASTAAEHDGMVTFYTATREVSQFGAVACSSCHPDGRSDGLTWQIGGRELQTPILAGRVRGTAPYRWDGSAADLPASIADTVKRLGGRGLDAARTQSLVAYLEAMPSVPAPTRDARAVARGKAQFEALGCAKCHRGSESSDGARHPVTGTLREVDTPSLRGLAASAPYFHDGSAPTLEAVLRDRGSVHGMTRPLAIDDAAMDDLITFLESL